MICMSFHVANCHATLTTKLITTLTLYFSDWPVIPECHVVVTMKLLMHIFIIHVYVFVKHMASYNII